jgi:hypothetical protein
VPSSPNRHRLEIPTGLYKRLEQRAKSAHMTVAALVTDLLTMALDQTAPDGATPEVHAAAAQPGNLWEMMHTMLTSQSRQMHELVETQRQLDRHLQDLSGVVHDLVEMRGRADTMTKQSRPPSGTNTPRVWEGRPAPRHAGEVWQYLEQLPQVEPPTFTMTQIPEIRELYRHVDALRTLIQRLPQIELPGNNTP